MSEAEHVLARLIEVIADQIGQRPEDITDPVATLDEIFHHKAACGLIERRGRHWFSDEDSERLHKAAYDRSRDMTRRIHHPFLHQTLAALSHCYTGEDFTHLMTEVILQASEQLTNLQNRILDAAKLTPGPAELQGDVMDHLRALQAEAAKWPWDGGPEGTPK